MRQSHAMVSIAATAGSPIGQEAKEWVKHHYEGREAILTTERKDGVDERGKYGRILGIIRLPGEEESLNDALVRLGHAERWE